MGQLGLYSLLTLYTISSPFAFMWFHHTVLRQRWDNDLADQVTVVLYVLSNLLAGVLGYWVQTAGCGK